MLRADCDAVEASHGAGVGHLPAVPVLGLGQGHLTHLGACSAPLVPVGGLGDPSCPEAGVWGWWDELSSAPRSGCKSRERQPAYMWTPVVQCSLSSLTDAVSSACPLPRWHVPKALPRPVCSGPFRSPPPAQTKAGPAPKEGARQPVPQLYPSRTARPCPY